ncbi:hypothetical protein ACFQ3N_13575 [Virgibacillus byunsanensis]|uniref:Uncharacterized protein n=1 Tax=Virgibacillus byunsanensis TaxID=570945 RepID=A0ABW3LRC9_9BACI
MVDSFVFGSRTRCFSLHMPVDNVFLAVLYAIVAVWFHIFLMGQIGTPSGEI